MLYYGYGFPGVKGFVINMAGICIQMIIAFFRGRFFGGGNVHKLLNKYEGTRQILEKKTSTHALLLFAFRIVPFTPMNTVSRLYGSMEIGFWEYLLISMGGFAPRVVSYTMMGRNVFDPLSPSFIVPIIVLLVISGVSALILNLILDRAAKNTKEKTGEKA